ncbi:SDR family oxidoreductase [Chamaesiphon polymorphus]|uniref:Short-chain dehydrogenase n=1 Tax=Chamaesiphon polymorphus CCALA 037 TaxID=2107692 RepID=A0A2T1GBR0_9CYAN|nr:SDR family oxidoreductase [Chamaesiphon polymorphus]PSB54785.1 short-chain dehydrogenase [Chamaesiphon polymorphus CCALA 037]
MNVRDSVAFVTGANRGIGKAYVEALLQAGTRRIYATARSLESLADVVAIAPDRIIPIALDVTDLDRVKAAAETAQDVTLLINNAGVIGSGGLFTPNSVETAQWEMNTNYFGTLSMVRVFAPILQRNGGGAIVNMLSVVSIASAPVFGSYSASKAALHSLTQDIRAELAAQGTQVVGVFPGPVDTAMTEGLPVDKTEPIAVAQAVLQAVEAGLEKSIPIQFLRVHLRRSPHL